MRYTFESAHAGLYRYTPKVEMDGAFDRLALPRTELEFLRLLMPLIDLVHDAHTTLRPSRATLQYIGKQAKVFPLDVRYVKARAFVERNFSSDSTIPLAGEILSINGRSMSEITETVLSAKSADGFNQAPKYEVANVNFWISFFELVDASETFVVEVSDPRTGKALKHSIPGVPASVIQRGQFETPAPGPFSLKLVADSTVAVMTIPDFADLALARQFAGSFHRIREEGIRTLIIDLRNNSGGYDELNVELLSYLVPHPYRIYEDFTFRAKGWDALKYTEYSPDDFWNTADLNRTSESERAEMVRTKTLADMLDYNSRTNPAAGTHQPKQTDFFAGDLYLLFNGRSNSSGGEIPALLHFLGIGTLIGDEPNAACQGTTAGIVVTTTLPNSGIQANVPLIAYHNGVLPGLFAGRGAPPHFTVGETLKDAIQERDTVLEFTLQLIAGRASRR